MEGIIESPIASRRRVPWNKGIASFSFGWIVMIRSERRCTGAGLPPKRFGRERRALT